MVCGGREGWGGDFLHISSNIIQNASIISIAKKIEGLNKNSGVHPSGIAISYDELINFCPVQKANDGSLVTGYDMNWVSELMVKFDILGPV